MKKIKYLIGFILIVVGFLFNGEIFILHLDNFQDSYYRSSFAFDTMAQSILDSEIIDDFISTGIENQVDFFMVDSKIKSAYHEEIKISGTKNAINYIKSRGISEGKYNSLFMGTVDVQFIEFDKVVDIKNHEYCYYIGDESEVHNIRAFKADLINKYGGGFPKLYGSDRELWMNLVTVWLIIFTLILIIAMYEVVYKKKEVAIRIVLGEDVKTLFMRNILLDTVFFLVAFLGSAILFSKISNVYFKVEYYARFFALFILLNLMINATIFLINFKKHLSNNSGFKVFLTLNYGLKTIITVLTIFILSSNLVILSDSYNLYKQRTFFEMNKDYSYYRLNYKIGNEEKTFEDEGVTNQIFYNRFWDKSFQYSNLTGSFDNKYPIVLINRPSMYELSKKWLFLEPILESCVENKAYILRPHNIQINSVAYENAEKNYEIYFDKQRLDESNQIIYPENIKLIGIDNQEFFKSTLFENPLIIFDNTSSAIDVERAQVTFANAAGIMYDISEEDFDTFIEEFQLKDQIVVKSNVLDVYEYNWSINSRNAKLIVILSLFLIFLEMFLVVMIIRMEYRYNAIEMSLKKIYGYSIFERNSRIISVTIFSAIFSMLGTLVIYSLMGVDGRGKLYIFGCGISLMVMTLIYIVIKAKMIENERLSSILKGEHI